MRPHFPSAFLAASAFAQARSSTMSQWTMTLDAATAAPGATVARHLEAHIDPDWHMYSPQYAAGPHPTTIKNMSGAAIGNVAFRAVLRRRPQLEADTLPMAAPLMFFIVVGMGPGGVLRE